MTSMTTADLTPIAELRAWQDAQTPLTRALTEPFFERASATLTRLQAALDAQAVVVDTLRAENEVLRRAYAAAQDSHGAPVPHDEPPGAQDAARTGGPGTAAQQQLGGQPRADGEALDGEHLVALQALNARLDEQVALIEELRGANQELEREHAMALQVTTSRINQLERHLHGQRSERSRRDTDPNRAAKKRLRNEKTEEQKKAAREAAARRRQAKLDKLTTVTVDLPLPDDEADSGRALPSEESSIFEWQEGRLVRIVFRRAKKIGSDGGFVTAPPPPQVVEGGRYGPALHAKVAMDKCLDAMPLRRQERAFERRGIPLPISVICSLFHRSARAVEPIYKALIGQLSSSPHVSADETPQPVLADDRTRKGWMWVFATEEAVVFAYSPSRGGSVPDAILGDSKGTLTVDGHTGYNVVTTAERRTRGGCWSHARRGLFESQQYDEGLIDGLLSEISELYYIEAQAIEQQIVGTPEHLEVRRERSAPVVARVFATIEANVARFDKRSSVAKAMQYILNQRGPLELFLSDARVPLHNNLSERVLRIVALLRKNALFVGSDDAGQNLAMLLTMAATCRLHDVDPERWLADVLIRVGERGSTVDELLPWKWKTGRGLRPPPAWMSR